MRLLLAALFLIGCGKVNHVEPTPTPIPGPNNRVILAVWGAPWCSVCHKMLPDIQSYLNVLPKADRDKIQFVLYTPTGATATAQPNIEIAYAYAKELGLSAEPKVDPWSWQMFKAHVSKYRALPAAALIDEKGETIRSFPPGSFSPEDPVNWAVRHTK